MAGRITYRHTELHNDGGWVSPVIMSEQVKDEIANLIIINRPLTKEEITSISEQFEIDKEKSKLDYILTIEEIASLSRALANIRSMRTDIKNAPAQCVKSTLASFTKLSASDAIAAYKESDSTTQALIDEALGCDLKFSGNDFLYPTGENIKKAAGIAHKNFTPSLGGRPTKGYRKILATYAINLWKDLGMMPCKPWQHPDYDPPMTPIVHFMMILASIVDADDELLHPKEAVTLLKQAKINS